MKNCVNQRYVLVTIILVGGIFIAAQKVVGRETVSRKSALQLQTELQEETSSMSKSAYVKKFEDTKRVHSKRSRQESKKSQSHKKLSTKRSRDDELTGSGHKASEAPEDEAAKFMQMLPWVLPIVCISILVLVGIGAKMCQAGNYKHTAALKESGVQPTFKYGGPIGAGPM